MIALTGLPRLRSPIALLNASSYEKGLQLVVHIEQLYQTDEEFRCWYDEGINEIEVGCIVTFSEEGWQEEQQIAQLIHNSFYLN